VIVVRKNESDASLTIVVGEMMRDTSLVIVVARRLVIVVGGNERDFSLGVVGRLKRDTRVRSGEKKERSM